MKQIEYVISNPLGVHARPAAQLAQCCVSFKSQITLTCGDKSADGDNVLQILSLHAKNGNTITVSADGPDEDEALAAISKVLHEKFEEHKAVSILKIAFFGTKDYDRTFFDQLSEDVGDSTYNCDIHYFTARLTEETTSLARGYDAVCIFVNDECNAKIVRNLKDLGIRLILLRCAGFNNVDLKAAKECGITVLRVPAYSPYALAEHAMALIQAANRRIHKAYNKVRDNNFSLSGLMGLDLHNKVAGIMGTGKIGECMARICKGYGMTVLGWDAYPNQRLVDEGLLTYASKEEVLSRADLISLHAPLIMGENGTYHLIDTEAIRLMKDDVMLVNTARGPLIDTEALIDALKKGKFHAVALDVYEGEDPNVYTDHSDDPLPHSVTARLTMFPNLILTSHQAFFTREALQAIAVTTMENARNFNEGRDLGSSEVK